MFITGNNNTNIDNEFEKDNVLSRLLKFLIKYKIILIVFLLLVITVIIVIYISNNKTDEDGIINYIYLTGDEEITLYKGNDYIEPGYKAYNSNDNNLEHEVIINSNLDINKVGEYEISYTLDDTVLIRKITVIERPADYAYIYLKTVKDNVNVYLNLGEVYKEPGYMVFSSTGKNLTGEVVVSGKVDTSKKGNYKLVYSLVDSNGVTVSASRTVVVMDSEINLFLNTKEYTNKDITINVSVIDNYFDYLMLPDGNKITKTSTSYKVSENGTYKFTVYNKKGVKKESSIVVNNIDKVLPTGSCSGSFQNGASLIDIVAKDNVGIDKYIINNEMYTSDKIKIDKEYKSVDVLIYDTAGNTKKISCNLKDENKAILFGDNIKLSYQYFTDASMPYGLYTPSVNNGNKKIPLIIWLHGAGEYGIGGTSFKNTGLLKVLNNWNLEGFNAYVLCPHVTGKAYTGNWYSAGVLSNFNKLVDKIIKEKNIDTKKIILVGHSSGGIGVQYMAYHRQNFYSSMVVLSGYDTGLDLTAIRSLPTKGYVEPSGGSYSYMIGKFVNYFGSSNLTVLSTSHGDVPRATFVEDKNNDGRSDIIEWMLNQELK